MSVRQKKNKKKKQKKKKLKLGFCSVVTKLLLKNLVEQKVPAAVRSIFGGKMWRPQAPPGFFSEMLRVSRFLIGCIFCDMG